MDKVSTNTEKKNFGTHTVYFDYSFSDGNNRFVRRSSIIPCVNVFFSVSCYVALCTVRLGAWLTYPPTRINESCYLQCSENASNINALIVP